MSKKNTKQTTTKELKPKNEKITIAKKKKKVEFEPRPTLNVMDNNKFRKIGNDIQLKNKAVVTYGKFNPPTIGHQTIAEELEHLTENEYDAFLFTTDAGSISFDEKIDLLSESMGSLLNIVTFPVNNPIMLFQIMEQYYDDLTIVVGPDRYDDFKRMANTYNGKDFVFERIEVINYVNPDVDRARVSSTKLREYIAEGRDIEAKQIIAPNLLHMYEEVKSLFV